MKVGDWFGVAEIDQSGDLFHRLVIVDLVLPMQRSTSASSTSYQHG